MKEVKIKFKDLSQDRRDAIFTLTDWLFHLYKENGLSKYYQTYNWISKIPNQKSLITTSDLETLKELWDIYAEYKRMEKKDA
jgi:hypothetical protein